MLTVLTAWGVWWAIVSWDNEGLMKWLVVVFIAGWGLFALLGTMFTLPGGVKQLTRSSKQGANWAQQKLIDDLKEVIEVCR